MLGRLVGGEAGKRVSRDGLARLASVLRQLAGMPIYSEYLKHMRNSHPKADVLSEPEFYTEHLRCRYADGPTRCC